MLSRLLAVCQTLKQKWKVKVACTMNQRVMIATLVRMMEAWVTVMLQLVTVMLLQHLGVTPVTTGMDPEMVLAHMGVAEGEGEACVREDQE